MAGRDPGGSAPAELPPARTHRRWLVALAGAALVLAAAWAGCQHLVQRGAPGPEPTRPWPEGRPMVVLLVYGYSQSEWRGLSPQAVARHLSALGVQAVMWGGMPYREAETRQAVTALMAALRQAGVRSLAEVALFVGWDVPGSRPTLADGRLLPVLGGWYRGANPSVPEVRRQALARIEEALRLYPELDGVWLDFVRWPIHWEVPDWERGVESPLHYETSFDEATVARFARDTGVPVPADLPSARARAAWLRQQAATAWSAWRAGLITAFAREARALVKAGRPERVLGAFTVPWREDEYSGAILRVVGQDYRALAGVVDVFSPMVYHQMLGRPVAWVGEFRDYTARLTGKPVWPVVAAFSTLRERTGQRLPPEELAAAVRAALGVAPEGVRVPTAGIAPGRASAGTASGDAIPSTGVIFFHYGPMVAEGTLEPALAAARSLGR